MATGWLGWAPQVAWSTPIPEILLAMDARIEWVKMTNPFGSGEKKEEGAKSPDQMKAFLRSAGR